MHKIFTLAKKICYNEYFILTCMIVLAIFVRLYKINSPVADWHSFRQADTASVSREYLRNGINLLTPKYHDLSRVQSGKFNPQGYRFVEFPIYNAIHAFMFTTIGYLNFEVWGRLLSVIFALISGILIYLIGKLLYDKVFGFTAAATFLFLPFNIYFTRVILPEPLAVLLGIASLFFFVKYTKSNNIKSFVASAVFMSLGVMVKPYVIFYVLPLVLYFLFDFGLKGSLKNKNSWIYLFVVFLPFIAWRLWIGQHPEGIPFWAWTFNGDHIRFKPAFWYWMIQQRLSGLILGGGGLLAFSLGLVTLRKRDFFVAGLALGAFLYICVFATANVRHDYYQSLVIPAVSFLIAKGVLFVWNNKNLNKYWARGVLLAGMLIGLLNGAFQVKEFYKINHPEIVEAGKAVDRLTPEDAIVIANYNGDTAFLYQTKRRGWPVVELPINELIEEGAQYYVSVNFDDQTNSFMKKYETVEKNSSYVILDLRKPLF